MKIAIIVVLVVFLLIIAWLFLLGFMSRSGGTAGLENQRLSACPGKPNCVCSEYPADSAAYVEPIVLPASQEKAWPVLKRLIIDQGGHIETETGNYLSAVFTSKFFRFIDDFEIRLDVDQGVVHVRSASRVGRSDLGANRQRVEVIKRLFANEQF